MHPPLSMLVYPGQHSKWRVGVLNLLKLAIIKVYFPWYQRNSSEKQATRLWGILSIKYWLAAPAVMKSWKWINMYSAPSTFIGTHAKFPSSELSKGHEMTCMGSVAGQGSLVWGGKRGIKTNQLLPCFLVKKLAMSHYDISQHREDESFSLSQGHQYCHCPFCRAADMSMVPKPRCNLAKELQKA